MQTTDEVEPFSDEELCELALGADPDQPLDADAIPLAFSDARNFDLLPHWYMPPVMWSGGTCRWRKAVIIVIVATLVTIEALGLCSVFGQVVIG